MGFLIGAGILLGCVVAAWAILNRPMRQLLDEVRVDHARASFHQRREWLEARFISALGRIDPAEGQRWENAQWHDEVTWARDRRSRYLLALVAVHFEPDPFELAPITKHATAVFEYRRGRWYVDGRRLDEMRPDEAIGRNQRFEAVVVTRPDPRRVG
jgi:hypothetical protein